MELEQDIRDIQRQRIFDWFVDWDIFVDVMPEGNIFKADVNKMFSDKKNFEVFYYDDKANEIAIRPVKGMHERMHDPEEHLPNIKYGCKELWNEDKLAIYRVHDQPTSSEDDDEGYWEACVPEPKGYVSRTKWEKKHPQRISLLIY
jgi:hypothetical protein